MDKKLASAPQLVVVIFFMAIPSSLQGVQVTEKGWLSYINIWAALQRCLSLNHVKSLSKPGVELLRVVSWAESWPRRETDSSPLLNDEPLTSLAGAKV